MGVLTVKGIEAKVRANKPGRFSDGNGLYLVIPKSGKPFWMLRYTSNKKRREMTLGKLIDFSLSEARLEAAKNMHQHRQGTDPLLIKKRAQEESIVTVDDLFEDWQKENLKRLKHPQIPKRIYTRDIQPHIGDARLDSIQARDVRKILQKINESGRPSIANDALGYCKQMFNHGIKLDVIGANPASAFTVTDAGGIEGSKDRALTIKELKFFFTVAKNNSTSFSRENYLACGLLVSLGVRKTELTEAKWSEFNLDNATWNLPKERSKSNSEITIPLSEVVVAWLNELKVRACESDYVFPSRRQSKKPYMGADTLNRAITKLFGHEAGKKKQPPNKMGDIKHFTVHDLRRTCRTLLAAQGTPGHVAERCLNHKLKGVEGIYDKYDYFKERKAALSKLSITISKLID
ncbi:tyrosine-type recombinase/integrase [Hydrogenovibrio marinus]|uniref:Integrase n=1 Tax=Hydrogenovibrio marinus TaxID=28885 RepID=A0A066ZVC3_HYDMR|nr:site-specific integrase [Hydrogenovibrio marinus]KDN96194.1 integrase [Hydrogenovibrio marinus]BBN60629.1 integrase [Hydrogenovibrio marinus]